MAHCRDHHQWRCLSRNRFAAIFKTAAALSGMNATNIAGHRSAPGWQHKAASNGSSRVRHREDHASPFASCFAAPHPAGEMFREDASAGLGR